jgi:hypothetical protein
MVAWPEAGQAIVMEEGLLKEDYGSDPLRKKIDYFKTSHLTCRIVLVNRERLGDLTTKH